MKLDYQNELEPAGSTLTATAILPGPTNTVAYDQSTAGRHMENGASLGLAVLNSAFSASGTETYQFQIINDTANDGVTSATVVADTGTMQNTDARLTSKAFFLPIPPMLLTKRYVLAKFTGANSPSITFGAWIMTRDQFQQWVAEPENFTP